MRLEDHDPIRVTFDGQIFAGQHVGGISRYFSALIRTFMDHPDLRVDPAVALTRTNNAHLRASPPFSQFPRGRRIPRGSRRLARRSPAFAQALWRYQCGASKPISCAMLHVTNYQPSSMDLREASLSAVTVVDTIPELLDETGRRSPHRGKGELLNRADVIFSISEETTRNIHRFFPEVTCPILTTPLAVDDRIFRPLPPSRGVLQPSFPYVLFVGGRAGYKNFDILPPALRQVRGRGFDVGLVVAGTPLNAGEWASLATTLPADRTLSLTPTDHELAGLYAGAVAFVFPSLLEGFGLPVLEAMSCGCPVLLSDTPVFHEVGAAGGVYFDASSSESLALELERLLVDTASLGALQQRGFLNAARFSWERTARLTASGYHLALARG